MLPPRRDTLLPDGMWRHRLVHPELQQTALAGQISAAWKSARFDRPPRTCTLHREHQRGPWSRHVNLALSISRQREIPGARVSQKKGLSQKRLVSCGDNHYVAVAQFRTPVAVCWSVGIRTRGAERRLPVQSKAASRVKSPRRRLAVVSERRQSCLDGCFKIPPVLVLGSRI